MLNYKTLKAGLLIFLLAMSMIMTAQTTQNKNFQPAFAAGYIFGANLSPHQYNLKQLFSTTF
jgi:hypothetical protein